MTPLLLATVVLAHGPRMIAAQHDVTAGGDQVVVQTRWSDAAVADDSGTIELVVPLPAAAQIEGAVPRLDDRGSITALQLAERDPTVRIVVALDDVRHAGALPLPIAARSTMQRVAVDDTLTFLPDPALELALNLGHTLPLGMRMRDREAIDRELGVARPRLGAVYVGTASIERAGGVIGRVDARAVGRRRAAIAAGVVFVVLCCAGAWGYRHARRSAEAEHADLVLAAELDALDDTRPPPDVRA